MVNLAEKLEDAASLNHAYVIAVHPSSFSKILERVKCSMLGFPFSHNFLESQKFSATKYPAGLILFPPLKLTDNAFYWSQQEIDLGHMNKFIRIFKDCVKVGL